MTFITQTRDQISRRALFVGAGALSFGVANVGSIAVANAGEAPRKFGPSNPAQAVGAESWLSGLALQAATYAAPIVAMYNLRDTMSVGLSAKAPPNEIWRVSDIANPEVARQLGYVTPNVNVIYGFGFMDLAQQPIVLKAPDSRGRYYMVQICDMWTNSFAYIGGLETGYKGGIYALVGPGWQGELPVGLKRIDCPTRWIELQPRVHVKNAADLAAAREAGLSAALLDRLTLDARRIEAMAAAAEDIACPELSCQLDLLGDSSDHLAIPNSSLFTGKPDISEYCRNLSGPMDGWPTARRQSGWPPRLRL